MSTNRRRASLNFGEKMMFFAGILFCLVLITTAMMGGLFARYTTTGTGSDSARVAKFGDLTLTETGDFDGTAGKKGMIIPGVDLKKEAKLSFTGSEMATYVFVEITAPGWTFGGNMFSIGTNLSWRVAEGWTYLPGSRYVFYRELAPGETLLDENQKGVDIILNGKITVEKDIDETAMEGLKGQNLTISIQASVIQSGGFDSPAEAWAYLNNK